MYCDLWGEWCEARAAMAGQPMIEDAEDGPAKNPLMQIIKDARNSLRAYVSLIMVARARVGVQQDDTKAKAAELDDDIAELRLAQ